jgi:hypothetical protein
MRLRKIKSMAAANHFLQEQYLPNEHNKKFMVLPKNLEPAWRKLPKSICLDHIFCIKNLRTVKNDHTYSFNGMMYKITCDFKYSIQNQKIEIRTYLDGTTKVYFADREISVVQHHIQPQIAVPIDTEIIIDQENSLKVRKDSHIEYQKRFYSVAEKHIGKQVKVSEQGNTILIYYRLELIESHQKLLNAFTKSSTKAEHLGPWQKTLKPSSFYRKSASAVGPFCDKIIFSILQRGQGVVDNRSIWGIIDLQKEYGQKALEEACYHAEKLGLYDYRGVSSILRLRYRKKASSA